MVLALCLFFFVEPTTPPLEHCFGRFTRFDPTRINSLQPSCYDTERRLWAQSSRLTHSVKASHKRHENCGISERANLYFNKITILT